MPPQSAASNQQKASDPLAPLNYKILNFKTEVDGKVFHPVASGWATVVPKPARQCIYRFFNVAVVPRFTNAVFQLKLKDAGGELARFAVNSTIGIAGLSIRRIDSSASRSEIMTSAKRSQRGECRAGGSS
jgi:phospholipid-binding lipoprotein MlaA